MFKLLAAALFSLNAVRSGGLLEAAAIRATGYAHFLPKKSLLLLGEGST
jgi:hypothetical protein